MDYSFDFAHLVKDIIIDPGMASVVPLFITSLLNEIISFFPYAVVISGQLVFLKDPLSVAMLAKLLVFVAFPVGVGGAVGVLPHYFLGYFGGRPAIDKFKKYLRFSWGDVERINKRFTGAWYDEAIFFLLRMIPVFPAFPVTIAAGVLRMRFAPFFVLTVVGLTIRMMITLLVIGFGLERLSEFMVFLYTD